VSSTHRTLHGPERPASEREARPERPAAEREGGRTRDPRGSYPWHEWWWRLWAVRRFRVWALPIRWRRVQRALPMHCINGNNLGW